MRKLMAPAGIFAVTLLLSAPATAAGPQTWISAAGTDAGTCPISAPCRTVSYAASQTDDGGEIHVIGSISHANIFVINQDKFYSVIADGHAVFSPDPTVDDFVIAVAVSASTEITLRGVHIDQRGGETRGIWFTDAGALHIEDCVIWNGDSGYAIDFAPSGAAELYISNCVIRDSGAGSGGGILIRPTGSGSAKVVLDNVHVENNRGGILIDGTATTGTNAVTIRNSTVAGSNTFGIYALDSGGGATNVTIEGSTSANNGTWGMAANGANVTERVRNSTVSGNARGLIATNTSNLISHGGNVVAGNTVNGAFTSSLPQQ